MNANLLRRPANCLCKLRNRLICESHLIIVSRVQCFFNEKSKPPQDKSVDENLLNPIKKTFKIIKNDFKKVGQFLKSYNILESLNTTENSKILETTTPSTSSSGTDGKNNFCTLKYPHEEIFQTHCDVVIIGGGGIGASVAYWLKQKARDGLNVVVVERDPTVRKRLNNLTNN